jgi:hypothetical protein
MIAHTICLIMIYECYLLRRVFVYVCGILVAGVSMVCVILREMYFSHASRCSEGLAPIHLAAQAGHKSCLMFLQEHVDDVNVQDR